MNRFSMIALSRLRLIRMPTLHTNITMRYEYLYNSRIYISCESFLYIEGRLSMSNNAATEGSATKPLSQAPQLQMIRLAKNCVAFIFDEIRYELDGVEIDKNRNIEIISTINNIASLITES